MYSAGPNLIQMARQHRKRALAPARDGRIAQGPSRFYLTVNGFNHYSNGSLTLYTEPCTSGASKSVANGVATSPATMGQS
jgi:hypothetical protein